MSVASTLRRGLRRVLDCLALRRLCAGLLRLGARLLRGFALLMRGLDSVIEAFVYFFRL